VVTGTKLTGPQARTLLGRFLFSGEDVEKPVAALSGGERRRLALLRTVVSGANLLVLDEPTNHLDIESREALEDALLGFPGTLLFVSHDRALIEALATRTLAIEAGRLTAREGGFGDYAQAHAAPLAAAGPAKAAKAAKPAGPKEAPERRTSQRAAKQAAKLERAIATLEEELGALETRLSQPDSYEDDALVAEDGTRHQELQEELAYLYREWERHAAEAG
jgi:ATP-binding cassette subfamily F protein 3